MNGVSHFLRALRHLFSGPCGVDPSSVKQQTKTEPKARRDPASPVVAVASATAPATAATPERPPSAKPLEVTRLGDVGLSRTRTASRAGSDTSRTSRASMRSSASRAQSQSGFQVRGRDSSGDYAFSLFCGTRDENSAGVCVDDSDRSIDLDSIDRGGAAERPECTDETWRDLRWMRDGEIEMDRGGAAYTERGRLRREDRLVGATVSAPPPSQ